MAILMVNDQVDFNTLKDHLNASDGNLASHLKALEKNELIEVNKKFVGRKPQTNYKATQLGRISFEKHIDGLNKLINGLKE